MRLKIERISRKEIKTRYGMKWKLSVLSNKEWYSAWAHPLNKDWKEGQTIEVDVQESTGSDGRVYHNIVMPQVERVDMNTELADIKEKLNKLLVEVICVQNMIKKRDAGRAEPPPHTDEDQPLENYDYDKDEPIPF